MAVISRTDWETDDALLSLEGWARDGLTDKVIAQEKIGIAEATFCRWKKQSESIRTALKKGKTPVDVKVENSLLKRALGYEVEETVTEIYDVDGERRRHVKKIKKHIPGDTTAMIYWLKNRRPDKWRDRQEAQQSGAVEKLDAILENMERVANADTEPKTE